MFQSLAIGLMLFALASPARAFEIEVIALPGAEARAEAFRAGNLQKVREYVAAWESVAVLPSHLRLVFNEAQNSADRSKIPVLYG